MFLLSIVPSAIRLFLAPDFLPHGYCYLWDTPLLWTHLISDVLIGTSYVVISFSLGVLVYRLRGEIPFSMLFIAFGLFIVACGMTHFMEVWTLWHPSYWLAGGVKVVTAGASVITAIAMPFMVPRAEAAIRAANDRLTAIFNGSPLAVVAIDQYERVTMWNPAAERMFGWTATEVIGKTLPYLPEDTAMTSTPPSASDGATPRNAESTDAALHTGAAGGSRQEMRLRQKNGTYLTAESSTAPLHDQNGQIVGWMKMLGDVTQAKQLEAQLSQAQKMEAVGQLAGGVAHDFNNLLTVIQASLDIAMRELPPQEAFNMSMLQDGRHAAERAEGLTRQLLTFSRQQVIQPKVFRLDGTVTEIQRLLARVIGEDIHLVTTFDPSMPFIEADPGQIGQVILNLAINAREAMPHGGTLTIRTSTKQSEVPQAVAKHAPGRERGALATWAVLEVTDTGIGMDEATQERIFEPFFTTRGDRQGTGLGLSVVYGIVSQSGGHIEVESHVGTGTTFRIFFPVCQAPAGTPVAVDPGALRRGTETILVVEDEVSVRSLVQGVLSQQGYTVIVASNGDEALRWMEQHGDTQEVKLLISDVVMPSMGGRELVRELTRHGFEMPVVFMSGYTNDPAALEGVLGERAVFLSKPFNIHRLCEVVRQALDAVGSLP